MGAIRPRNAVKFYRRCGERSQNLRTALVETAAIYGFSVQNAPLPLSQLTLASVYGYSVRSGSRAHGKRLAFLLQYSVTSFQLIVKRYLGRKSRAVETTGESKIC